MNNKYLKLFFLGVLMTALVVSNSALASEEYTGMLISPEIGLCNYGIGGEWPSVETSKDGDGLLIEVCDNGIDDDGDGLIDCLDPDCGAVCDHGCLGAAADFVLLALNGGKMKIEDGTDLFGSIGYSSGVSSKDNLQLGDDGTFSGAAYVHSAIDEFDYEPLDFLPNGGIVQNNATVDTHLDQANLDALASSAFFSGQIPHLKLGVLDANFEIYSEDSITIVEVEEIDFSGRKLELIGQPGADGGFVINVLGDMTFDKGEIILTDVRPERVVFNFPNDSEIKILDKNAVFSGTILAPTGRVILEEIENFMGAIVADDISVVDGFIMTHAPLALFACESEICDNGIDDDGDGLVDCDDPDCGPKVNSHLPLDCNLTSSISEKFKDFPLAEGDYIWFSSQMENVNLPVLPATIYVDADTIRFSAYGTDYEVPVPGAVIHFSEDNSDWTTTSYDEVNQRWVTSVSIEHFNKKLFITGVPFQIPSGGLPAELDPVTWSMAATTDVVDLDFKWSWGAAVYSNFTTDLQNIGVKPVEDDKFNPYQDNHYKAAAPIFFVDDLKPGGTGDGGNKYTGSPSGSEDILPCRIYQCERFEICNNGIDDDGDGLTDCDDPDCGGEPVAYAGNNVEICKEDFATLGAYATAGQAPYIYSWADEDGHDKSNGQIISVGPGSTIDYIVTVTSATGCTATSSIEVKVNKLPKVNAGSNTTVCVGLSTILDPSASHGSGGFTYFWDNGLGEGDEHIIFPTENMTYSVTVTDSKGCTDVDDLDVEVVESPIASASQDTTICKGFNANLSVTASGAPGPYTYLWSSSAGTTDIVSVSPNDTKEYYVTVTADNGCPDVDTVLVTVDKNCPEVCGNGVDDDDDGKIDCEDSDCGPSVNAGGNKTICEGASSAIVAIAQGGPLPHEFSWNQGLGLGASKVIAPVAATTYTVTVTAASGCTDVDDITISISPCTEDCYNGVDDDGDGKVDCDDPDCRGISAPVLLDDEFYSCPGSTLSKRVIYNDANLQAPTYSISKNPDHGFVTINSTGKFTYTPFNYDCMEDKFKYEVCNTTSGCCEEAEVKIFLQDNTPPTLVNMPADLTLSCDDELPEVVNVVGFDNCSAIYVDFDEVTVATGTDECDGYTVYRIWEATDLCGNVAVDTQTIVIEDLTPPELFRVYTLPNGKKLLAGVSQTVGKNWKYVPFPIVFPETPIVFSQIISNEDAAAVVVQQDGITKSGFEMRLLEQEADDQRHLTEQVAWMAMEPGAFANGVNLEAGIFENVNDMWSGFTLTHAFGAEPSFILASQTSNEKDPFTPRYRNTSATGLELFLQEETSQDAETGHADETLGFIAIDQGANLQDEENRFIGESGQLTLTNAWTTVNLSKKYSKPAVITGGLTFNNGDPVTIRVRNVNNSSFEIRAEEWPSLDGLHSAETVGYLVVEGGLPGTFDPCEDDMAYLVRGENLFVRDNCDVQLDFQTHSENRISKQGELKERSWFSIDDCGNALDIAITDTCAIAAVKLRAMLQGPMLQNSGTTLMRDDLRARYQVPLEEPYSSMPGFYVVSTNGDVDDVAIPGEAQQAIYRTIADGDWLNPDTWSNGNVPPTGELFGETISVEHKVTISKELKLRSNSILYVTNEFLQFTSKKCEIKEGSKVFVTNADFIIEDDHCEIKDFGELHVMNSRFILNDGDLKIEEGIAIFEESIYGNGPDKGKIELRQPTSHLLMTGCTVNLGEDFRNEKGTRKLTNVQLNVGEDFVAEHDAIDTLINVSAVVGKKFEIKSNSSMHLVDCKIRVVDGNFKNSNDCILSGSNLAVWVENGNLEDDSGGTWTANVSQHCISGDMLVSPLMIDTLEDCTGLPIFFEENSIESIAQASTISIQDTVTLAIEQVNTGRLEPMVMEVKGENALVDWMLIELRDPGDETQIVAAVTAAIQRNGNIVTNYGDTVLYFPGVPEGDYYIALRHRNHLGQMTDYPYFLSSDSVEIFDFSDPVLPLRGGAAAGTVINGKRTLWGGDFNGDGDVIFQGPFNDIFQLFSDVLSDENNIDFLANHISKGYSTQDYNMDGKTIYQGPGNEKAMLLYYSVLFHPQNTSLLANFIVQSSLP